MWSPLDSVDQPLHVVTCISNTVRYRSRWKLYRDFQRHMRESGAILHTVEAAFGERNFALEDHALSQGPDEQAWKSKGPPNVPNKGHGTYTQVRLDHLQEVWLKENLLNIGVSRLPPDWKYVAFIDADVHFARPDIVSETLHRLQHYHVVQMFSEAIDLYPDYRPQPVVRQLSHGYCHVHGMMNEHVTKQNNGRNDAYGDRGTVGNASVKVSQAGGSMYRHPGFAWAWRREAFNMVGGLMEHVLLGSADWHMAWALLGRVDETISRGLSEPYKRICRNWERRAVEHIKFNIGYVPGTVLHNWHGKKRDRGYSTRWEIMVKNGYDPDMDLKKDWQGLLRLTDAKPNLRDDCREYFRRRDEDSIDV